MPGCRVNVATVLLLSSRFRGHGFQAEFGGVGGRSSRLRVARHAGFVVLVICMMVVLLTASILVLKK